MPANAQLRQRQIDIVDFLAQQSFRFHVRHDSCPTGHGFSKELAPKIRQSVVDRFLDTL
jgi:hypothetical protein